MQELFHKFSEFLYQYMHKKEYRKYQKEKLSTHDSHIGALWISAIR